MLSADFMPRTDYPALEQRECGLNGIGVDVPVNVDAILVFDRLVLPQNASIMQRLWISGKLISHNHVNIAGDILFDVLRQRAALYVLSMEEAELSAGAALTDTDNNLLLAGGIARLELMAAIAPAYQGFVYFDSPAHRLAAECSSSHRSAYPVAEIPCRLVALLSKHPVDLTCGDAFLGFG